MLVLARQGGGTDTAQAISPINQLSIDMQDAGNGVAGVGDRDGNTLPDSEGVVTIPPCGDVPGSLPDGGPGDDDFDGIDDDGCPGGPPTFAGSPEYGLCGNAADDDKVDLLGDGALGAGDVFDFTADDGCVTTLSTQETCIEIWDDGILNMDEDTADRARIDITVGSQPGPGGGIPAGEFMTAFGWTLNWDIEVIDGLGGANAPSPWFLITSAGGATPFSNITNAPAVLSPLSHGVSDSGTAETGPGVLSRAIIEGNAPGLATLTLSGVSVKDTANVDFPITLTADGTLVAVSQDGPDAGVVIGDSAGELFVCPTTVDITVPTVTVTAPGAATVGLAFAVTVDATIGNSLPPAGGGVNDVNVDVTVTLAPPADCTAAGGNVQLVGDHNATPGASAIPTQTYMVTCTDASAHNFSATVSAVIDDVAFIEGNAGNNSNPPSGANNSPQNTNVTDTADVKILSQTMTGFAALKCPAPSPLCSVAIPLSPMITGVPQNFTVSKDIHNNGPYKVFPGLLQVQVTKGMFVIPTPGVINPAVCPVVPPGGGALLNLQVSVTLTHPENFSVTCTMPGIGVDDDADTIIDDGGSDPKYETPTICVSNTVLDTNTHVTDPSPDLTTPSYPAPVNVPNGIPDNNEKITCKTVLLERPFTTSFTKVWDENDVPSDPIFTPPTDDDCLLTLPCEIKADYSINAGGNPQDEPLAGLITTYPGAGPLGTSNAAPAAPSDYALYVTKGFGDAFEGTVKNGVRVGNVTFSTYIDSLTPHTCSSQLPGTLRLYDAAIPFEAGEGPNVAVSRIATPFYSGVIDPAGVGGGGASITDVVAPASPPYPVPSGLFGTTFIDLGPGAPGSTNKIGGNTAGTTFFNPAAWTGGVPVAGDSYVIDTTFALVNPQVWPQHLETDPVVASVAAAYGSFPAARASVWAHYQGLALAGATQIPVNYVVFHNDAAGGDDWRYVAVVGDPTQPSGINQCTPFAFGVTYQGEVDTLTDEEPFWLCLANLDDDGDTIINDGCPQIGLTADPICGNNLDDDAADDIAFVLQGVIDDGCPAVGTGLQQDLITCQTINTTPGWTVAATWIRQDTGQISNQTNQNTCSANNDVVVDKSDILLYNVDANLPHTETVNVTVKNGAVPADVNVWATLTGPSVCNPTWDSQAPYDDADTDLGILVPPPASAPLLAGPEDIGGPPGIKTTRIAWREMGMDASAVPNPPSGAPPADAERTVQRTYTVNCPGPVGASYNFQIVVNAGSIYPDDNIWDNQDQNQPKATVTDDDLDNDGVLNGVDNCPSVVNPNQRDADSDGQGNACDTNDDNDIVADATDQCSPGLGGLGPVPQPDLHALSAAQLLSWREDADGVDDTDGCPDTATEIKNVIKNNPIEVDVSENHREDVTATASNKGGGITADLETTYLLRSPLAGDCQADWIKPQPGTPHNPADKITSQDANGYHFSFLVHTDLAVLPGQNRTSTHSYTVHCTDKSFHDNAVRLEISVAPVFPVREELNDVSDNVVKFDIDITAWENADVKKLGVFLLEDPVIPPNTPTTVIIRSVLHNNGPFGPVTVSDRITVSVPPDCATTDNPIKTAQVVLPVSINVVHDEPFTIICSKVSNHIFGLQNDILGIVDVHVNDPNPNNNSASGSFTQQVVANVTISVQQTVTQAPATLFKAQVGTINISKVITYTGTLDEDPNTAGNQVSVEVRKSVVTPGPVNGQQHCYSNPPGDIFQLTLTNNVPVNLQETFNVHCIDSHVPATFTINNQVTLKNPNIHILGTKQATASSNVDIIIGVDYAATGIAQVDPATGDCPPTGPITVIQDKHYPTHFCTSEIKLPVEYEIYAETPMNGLPNPNTLTPIVPGAVIKDIHRDLKLVKFVEPGWHHCVGPRCTVNGVLVPQSTIVWVFVQMPANVATCVVQPSNSTPYVQQNCYLDYWLKSLEVEWKKFDNAIQQWVEVGRHRFQEKIPPQWDDKHTIYVPTDVLSLLGYTPDGNDITPATTGVKPVTMTLEICIDQDNNNQCDPEPDLDTNNGNDVITVNSTVTVLPDPDADSYPTGQDNCPNNFNPGQVDTDGDTIGDACDSTPRHDDGVKYCNNFGPGAINITDNVGAYMWVVCEIGNFSGHNDKVHLDVTMSGNPACVSVQKVLIVPGQADFILLGGLLIDDDGDTEIDEDPIDGLDNDGDTRFDEDPPNGEQKFVLFRVRFECHSEMTPGSFPTTVTTTINHIVEPPDGDDTNASNDSKTIGVNIIVSAVTP
ncbi:MAG: thrombospondin type 3 repeat-containing protein [Dehalococcoidia bacterium]|nr:thrombospondin type 3 repeat-containing protein [Dehalococcoidia bacterium]